MERCVIAGKTAANDADGPSRRQVLQAAAGGIALAGLRPSLARATLSPAAEPATAAPRTWLGPQYWANRLQDWRLSAGRFECVAAPAYGGIRTVAVLTRELVEGAAQATLTVRTGTLVDGAGFSGFLVGAGGGALDPRAAALVNSASGTGGGLLAGYDSDGSVSFRDHADETDQFGYAAQPTVSRSGPAPARTTAEDVLLRLAIYPGTAGFFSLILTARDVKTGALLSTAKAARVADSRLLGGISLISGRLGSPATHWLADFSAGGAKVGQHPERRLGPVLGTLYSVSGRVLKCTAQLFPIGPDDPQTATFQYRPAGSSVWVDGPTAPVEAGYIARFRLAGWNSSVATAYRIVYGAGTPDEQFYDGIVPAEPGAAQTLTVAAVNCTVHSFRPLDAPSVSVARLPGEHALGLYTDRNLYFPYATQVENLAAQRPDLLVALGDQYYETRPTRMDAGKRSLDFLYRYYLWLWSFREVTARTPCVVLVDDHDVFQGNLWGHAGAGAPNGRYRLGGYVPSASFVDVVQSVQCGHNPDPYDASPALRGTGVYYTHFRYGPASFVLLEDRKFKTGDYDGLDAAGNPYPADTAQLLGPRQEALLDVWAGLDPGMPKICLTQTLWGCLQTDASGAPRIDYDSDGYPPNKRARAIRLLSAARAVLLGGDQHLGSLVRHGDATFSDGPVQFTAPASGTAFQRWFEPRPTLPNPEPTTYTGDYVDAFGNRMHVLAVANPPVTYAAFTRAHGAGAHNNFGDQSLKSEGYGVVRVDPRAGEFVFECWPWQADPLAGDAQFPGWPYRLPFDAV